MRPHKHKQIWSLSPSILANHFQDVAMGKGHHTPSSKLVDAIFGEALA